MSKKSRAIPRARRRAQQAVARKKGERWPDNIVKIVKDTFMEAHKEGPFTNESANYTVPVHWTKYGVAMWKSFVKAIATDESKEAAVATTLLINFMKRSGFIDLCQNVEQKIALELHQNSESKAEEELAKIRSQLLNNGLLVEDQNAQEAAVVENGTSGEKEQADGEGIASRQMEGETLAMEEG